MRARAGAGAISYANAAGGGRRAAGGVLQVEAIVADLELRGACLCGVSRAACWVRQVEAIVADLELPSTNGAMRTKTYYTLQAAQHSSRAAHARTAHSTGMRTAKHTAQACAHKKHG